jgi:hypothetical protein
VKKVWHKPLLEILRRGKPEERVLHGCKGNDIPTSFLSHHQGCHADEPACGTECRDPDLS